MLRTKDVITKLLDGLEMFLGVSVMFLNSSNSKIVGRWHIYKAHPVGRVVTSRYSLFCEGTGCTGDRAPV